jgi:ATP-dependent exoDNAse (exonuclease V) alpha subunit
MPPMQAQKLCLVGDPQQLQAIEAGAAFRAIHERHGGVEISEMRRQHEAGNRMQPGISLPAAPALPFKPMTNGAWCMLPSTREAAREALIEGWDRDRQASPGDARIILTHTNDEVRELNDAAFAGEMREQAIWADDVTIKTERGERQFASGDRIMFLRNERSLGVKNGTLGTVDAAHPAASWRCTPTMAARSRSTPRTMPMSIMAMPQRSTRHRG